jgi:hypothetical protein
MSCDRLQSSSAQIAFKDSSNALGNLKAVKHSGDVCGNVLNDSSLPVSDDGQVGMRWLARVVGATE